MVERKYILSKRTRRLIGRLTRNAMQAKLRRREKVSDIPPFGFVHRGQRLVEHPVEQEIIRKVVELRKQGLPLRKIGQTLDAQGICPTRGGKRWAHTTIQKILRREGVK